jgi:hypothetical protein
VLFVNDGHVCVESVEVCLLAFTGGDRLIEVVADVLPRTGAVSERVPQKIGTSEIGGAAPTSEIDLLIAPSVGSHVLFAFADLAVECDCHIASTD